MCDSVTATVLSTSTSSSLQSCWIVYTNNQGTERLVVTRRNNGPLDTSSSGVAVTSSPGHKSSHINAGGGGGVGQPPPSTQSSATVDMMSAGMQSLNISSAAAAATTATTTTEAALDYKSLNSILDDNLRPLKPVPGNPRSEQIHNEHKQLVQEYWEIQTQIVTNQAHRDALQMNIPAEELRLKKEYLKKLEEKEALLKFKANLQKQLDERKRLAGTNQSSLPMANTTSSPAPAGSPHHQHNHHQQSAPPPPGATTQSPSSSSLQRQDSTADAGWVIIGADESGSSGGNNPS